MGTQGRKMKIISDKSTEYVAVIILSYEMETKSFAVPTTTWPTQL
jgi:hypothetical protein